MNTKLFFRITAAVISLLTVFSCSKEIDELIDQPTEPDIFTLSIKASKGEFTKALELSGNTLNAIWDGSETVYVFKNDTQIGKLTPDISTLVYPEKVSCTLSGPFTTVPEAGDVLTLKLTSNNYSGQDGTLDFIAGHCDYAVATLHVTGVINGQIESTEGKAAFENQQAIVKFTLKDKADGTTLLTPTTLTVNNGTSDIATATIPAATYTTNGDGVLYVAIPPIAGKTLTLTATIGEDTYSYTRFPVTFAQGQYYTISVKMIKQRLVNLSTKTGNYEAQSGDILTGTLDGAYKLTIAPGATVTLNGVTHNAGRYISGIECLGSATIILAPGSVNDLTYGANTAEFGIGMTVNDYETAYVLTIEGSGKLTVSGGDLYAGIGGVFNNHHIVINGGDITATGGPNHGPGIGASSQMRCGNITINGGTINATGCLQAAGIGCGQQGSHCGDITFNGGNVTATKGKYGSGVGVNGQNSSCGNIYFSGGTVTVIGGIETITSKRIYVDGVQNSFMISQSPYYYPAQ
jgi:hypothetical protein